MDSTEKHIPLFQKLGLSPIQFLDGTKAWKLNLLELEAIKKAFGKDIVYHQDLLLGADVFSYPKEGITVYRPPFDFVFVFTSIEDANKVIPKIRMHGLFDKDVFWYFALDRYEVNELLAKQENLQRIPELELEDEIFVLQTPKSYLKRFGDGRGMWFSLFEHVKQHQDSIAEIQNIL